uniref:Uncharacterized protein n=1 Tax=Siphoviridae sp. ctBCr48 TaxID=2827802 RepID=A0A8S5SH94_9CAUD|nr:MAG TPA: hypothetical protein [Siphoviridae sp. ctBCr48]
MKKAKIETVGVYSRTRNNDCEIVYCVSWNSGTYREYINSYSSFVPEFVYRFLQRGDVKIHILNQQYTEYALR